MSEEKEEEEGGNVYNCVEEENKESRIVGALRGVLLLQLHVHLFPFVMKRVFPVKFENCRCIPYL